MMELQPVAYLAEGRSFTGYLADGSNGRPAPGVLVVHEGGGLTGHVKERATMLADLGYVAYAMDLFGMAPTLSHSGERDAAKRQGEGLPDFDLERAKAIVRELRADVAALRGRAGAALRLLADHPNVDAGRLAAIGFCFGGTAVIELARGGANLACTIGFHAGLTAGEEADNRAIKGKLLLCLGADDPVVTLDQRTAFAEEMSTAGVDWQIHLYGGVGHSFTNREIDAWNLPGFAYHETADRRSWAAMRLLLAEMFG